MAYRASIVLFYPSYSDKIDSEIGSGLMISLPTNPNHPDLVPIKALLDTLDIM